MIDVMVDKQPISFSKFQSKDQKENDRENEGRYIKEERKRRMKEKQEGTKC